MPSHQHHHVRQNPPGPHFRFNLPKVEIHIRRGVAKHPIRPVSDPVFLIGSAGDCDLVLADPRIPDVYAYIYVSHDKVTLRALGEGPEMTVNGHPIGAATVSDGDRVRTASYELVIRVQWPEKTDRDDETKEPADAHDDEVLPEDVRIGLSEIQSLLNAVRTLIEQEECRLRIYSGPEGSAASAGAADQEAVCRRHA